MPKSVHSLLVPLQYVSAHTQSTFKTQSTPTCQQHSNAAPHEDDLAEACHLFGPARHAAGGGEKRRTEQQ